MARDRPPPPRRAADLLPGSPSRPKSLRGRSTLPGSAELSLAFMGLVTPPAFCARSTSRRSACCVSAFLESNSPTTSGRSPVCPPLISSLPGSHVRCEPGRHDKGDNGPPFRTRCGAIPAAAGCNAGVAALGDRSFQFSPRTRPGHALSDQPARRPRVHVGLSSSGSAGHRASRRRKKVDPARVKGKRPSIGVLFHSDAGEPRPIDKPDGHCMRLLLDRGAAKARMGRRRRPNSKGRDRPVGIPSPPRDLASRCWHLVTPDIRDARAAYRVSRTDWTLPAQT